MKAAAIAALVIGTAGSGGAERHYVSNAAAWSQLSHDQQEMIDLVAQDIWETEREGSARQRFDDLGSRQKNGLRRAAMDRLGFDPQPIRGVEA